MRAVGEAAGLLFGMHLIELAAGRRPMSFVGMVRERGNPKFSIVPIPEEDWSVATSAMRKSNVQDAVWLVLDDEDQELSIYVMRIPEGEHEFDVIVDIQYDRDHAGPLAISKPRFRMPPDGDPAMIDDLWSAILVGMGKNEKLATASIAFGGLGDFAEDDDDE